MVTAEEDPFTDGGGDVKNVLSGSEIDGGESLSFWHSSSDHLSPWEAVAAEAQLYLLSFVVAALAYAAQEGGSEEGRRVIRYRNGGHGFNVVQSYQESHSSHGSHYHLS